MYIVNQFVVSDSGLKVQVMGDHELVYLGQEWTKCIRKGLHVCHQLLAGISKFLKEGLPAWHELHHSTGHITHAKTLWFIVYGLKQGHFHDQR